jgi:hypothetical protein
MYDVAAFLTLVSAGLALGWLRSTDRALRLMLWGLWGAGIGIAIAARTAWGGFAGAVAAAVALVVVVGLAAADTVAVRRTWPVRAMGVALCVLTSAGAFTRAVRFEQVRDEPLFPDVAYYRQQASRTWNPVAAGDKTPLWSALQAPLVRLYPDEPAVMRVLSCCAGIAVVPLTAVVIGRFLGNAVGVIVAGLCALDTWMIDLCCQGLREETNLILWLLLFATAFRRDGPSRRGWLGAGLLGGLLLLLRNTNLPALIVVLFYAVLMRRWRPWQGAVAVVLPILIVLPFYVNQWRQYGDAFHLEHRDARYYVNGEFGGGRSTPARPVSMPDAVERSRDPYAGDPVSPFAYLFRLRPLRTALHEQVTGVISAMLGFPYGYGPPVEWFGLLCAAGTIGLLVLPVRWMTLFVVASILGMQAHLIAIRMLEQRMILQAYLFWMAGGIYLLCAVVARGVAAWNRGAIEDRVSRESPSDSGR